MAGVIFSVGLTDISHTTRLSLVCVMLSAILLPLWAVTTADGSGKMAEYVIEHVSPALAPMKLLCSQNRYECKFTNVMLKVSLVFVLCDVGELSSHHL